MCSLGKSISLICGEVHFDVFKLFHEILRTVDSSTHAVFETFRNFRLTHLCPIHPFSTPENIRKPEG